MNLFEQTEVDKFDDYGNLTHRVCGICGKLKPIDSFYKNGKRLDGRPRYRRDCKTCYDKANVGRTQAYRNRKWEERYGKDAFKEEA